LNLDLEGFICDGQKSSHADASEFAFADLLKKKYPVHMVWLLLNVVNHISLLQISLGAQVNSVASYYDLLFHIDILQLLTLLLYKKADMGI